MQRKPLLRHYQCIVIVTGVIVMWFSLSRISNTKIDFRFVLLLFVTAFISSRVSIKIPRYDTYISLSNCFIILAFLLYGVDAATFLAAVEGISSGDRLSKQKKAFTILFNAAVGACAIFVSATITLIIVDMLSLSIEHTIASLIITLCLLGVLQFLGNSFLVSIGLAFKNDRPVLQMWVKHSAWASFSFFIGTASAGAIFNYINPTGIIALLVAFPVIYILYLAYNNFLNDINETNSNAERIERARAEQAERHIEEQKRHIAELQRISKELEESREHFRHAAFHDDLTDLPNRAFLTSQLSYSLNKLNNLQEQFFALLFLDLDRFKYINDSLGHAAGDTFLCEIARRIERSIRPNDTVARLGGDEFAILLNGLNDRREAVDVAERIQSELSRPFRLMGHEVFTAASIGIAFSNAGYDHPENILRDADTAMYRAKEKGKARYEVFDSKMHADALSRLKLENDLRRAVERREFQIHYQPIVSLRSGQIVGFEALVRWQHHELGLVSPAEFIPLAEETGLINDIGDFVLFESCRQISDWHSYQIGVKPFVTVNLSGKQLAQPYLIEKIKSALVENNLEPQYLKIEITESVIMENTLDAETFLKRLRQLGIKLCIDDFGTGYSSLSYLHHFPFNTLKIDRSFMSKISDGNDNKEIVKTIITLANNLGMNVVAEGVETQDQLSQLRRYGCSFGQGYLFSKPLPPRASFQLLNNNNLIPLLIAQTHGYRVTEDKSFGYISESLM